MNSSITTSRSIEVEHIRIASAKGVDQVRLTLEAIIPQRDTTVSEALERGNKERVEDEREHGPKLSLFLTRGHGRLLAIYGHSRKAYQYEIGNPITAASMTQHRLAASLYAPLRVALYEDDLGRGVFEYDRPSSLFGQFGDARVTEVAHALDASLKDILERAAG
ncbi:MAG TPA: DUF302 domain-containing protein [Steroidobacteraceae bacterium]|jgi:hypothetical protein